MPIFKPNPAILALVLFVLMPAFACGAGQPNIIYIVADDLGWKDIGFHGSEIATPHIDKLAAEGVELDQFYVQPTCSPTRSSMMTGRYPIRMGLQYGVIRPWAEYGLPLEERTLSEALKDAGYFTAITGKWHLGHASRDYLPTQRGFDSQHGSYLGALEYFSHRREGKLDWYRNDRLLPDEKGYTTALIRDEAVRIVEEHDSAKPLFLYVSFNAPHTPLQVPESYVEPYYDLKLNGRNLKHGKRKTFAGVVAAMDEAIGKIVEAVDERKWRENTLFIFHSDNGGLELVSDNSPLRGDKDFLYEGGVRVVALANWAGKIKPGTKIEKMMHVVDMYPTLVGLAGGTLKHEKQLPLDGVDVWPVIANGAPRSSDTILLNSNPFHGAVRVGSYKLVKNGHIRVTDRVKPDTITYELFDLATDPYEKMDLSGAMPAKLAELKAVLRKFELESATAHLESKPEK